MWFDSQHVSQCYYKMLMYLLHIEHEMRKQRFLPAAFNGHMRE